jgi:hypothetical protein
MMRTLSIGILALALVSCGGSSGGGGSCGQVEPCGGSVVGTWKASSACLSSAAFAADTSGSYCPTATFSNVSATQTGSYVFDSSTYTINISAQVSATYTVPASCNSSGTSCADLGAYLQAYIQGSTITCTGSGTCTCHLVFPATDSETGTYTSSGSVLTLTSDADGSTSTQSYCVQGSTLHLVDVDTTMNMGPMGQATIDDDATYTKQ